MSYRLTLLQVFVNNRLEFLNFGLLFVKFADDEVEILLLWSILIVFSEI